MSEETAITNLDVESWHDDDEERDPSTTSAGQALDPAEKYASSQLRVVRETKDYQLDYLKYALSSGADVIDTSPTFQRRLRWNKKQRSLLIESFLLNIPVPPIYLFEHDYNSYEVIDGKQRLETVKSFLDNQFTLTGLEYWPELNGKQFSELPKVLKNGLLRRSLSAVILLAETARSSSVNETNIDVRQVLFDRLNTGGVKLNPQELRNALYPGSLNRLINDLARTDLFTQAWDIPKATPDENEDPPEDLLRNSLYSSLSDSELVLRFFAIRDAVDNDKRGSLKSILDNYMKENQRLPEKDCEKLKGIFLESLSFIDSALGGDPFALPQTGRPSRPLYDALMVAASRKRSDQVSPQAARRIQTTLVEHLRTPTDYDVLVGRGNTIGAIHDRIALAEEILGQ